MITFANAKINIGLQVLQRRDDGYHDLETVFYPVKIYDVLEVVEAKSVRFISSGLLIPGDCQDNLCLKAYRLLKTAYDLPPVEIYLHKTIPIGAGLGGGSADAAFLLKLLNTMFALGMGEAELMNFARRLGSDCAFFIRNTPVLATGIGDVFQSVQLDLSSYHIVLVKPDVHISTATAYGTVMPNPTGRQLASALSLPIAEWHHAVFNDFEAGVFARHPGIGALKDLLYRSGAVYAAMSGSGSSVYGLFEDKPVLSGLNPAYEVFYIDNSDLQW
ncbi:4-(cytidine 5'-diphospho)-2-C-methyl-D-erythritol kinase [Parapedobacter deserti]|uniref:4-diphosphocytidyl-2-C-methyl-D-erythritol kinase n=1 Tax=Parapedobacter deserti TaxID=1912957 RepID=A0ABV7JIG4_9SPHI